MISWHLPIFEQAETAVHLVFCEPTQGKAQAPCSEPFDKLQADSVEGKGYDRSVWAAAITGQQNTGRTPTDTLAAARIQ